MRLLRYLFEKPQGEKYDLRRISKIIMPVFMFFHTVDLIIWGFRFEWHVGMIWRWIGLNIAIGLVTAVLEIFIGIVERIFRKNEKKKEDNNES